MSTLARNFCSPAGVEGGSAAFQIALQQRNRECVSHKNVLHGWKDSTGAS
jgi:hypothetical protein